MSHNMMLMPHNKTAADVIPQYSDVKQTLGPIGSPCPVCASCQQEFTETRPPKLALRIYPLQLSVPVSFLYRICGSCTKLYRKGGKTRDGVLAAIEKFFMGEQ